ncbi:histidinol dehydrogenase [Sulfoacidibacillus thermotolerans]|uniref:histidinol dehydrogenase n=1 Tax=Sulfoacidibacillus thermotolerans TaxID=1765684 RepID=A0A2U3DBP0_SULT2|nr:histidinol dehydrogenase [Sulfoacidibacillus thermotolerans]PWI58693.1 histidinol dehydrogenase [Sulfoacidibacillus thermotolerans]
MIEINRIYWQTADDEMKARILLRASTDVSEQMPIVAEICADVKAQKDAAVLKYTEQFDGVRLAASDMRVSEQEFAFGITQVAPNVAEALRYAAKNIRNFHEAQKPEPMWMMEVDEGILAGEKVTPISDVALYVPRGKGSFPSVLLMLGTPAVVVGVPRIVVLTPPNPQGKVDPAILFVAHLLGIQEVYKVGGAQAVAAAAYGTETIPKCAKIIGPGNPYVTAAKRLLMGVIDPGIPAGPSESIILADESADPYKAALDLLIEAEHGPDSAALLVTESEQLADAVASYVQELVEAIESPTRRAFVLEVLRRYGGIVITNDFAQSVDFVNAYAPEHLEVMVKDPFSVLPRIVHAGEILLGEHTPITLCNFLLGPNAILPTGRSARTISSVSLHDFMKRSSIGYVSETALQRIAPHAIAMADVEGFETHGQALRKRLK